jgi:hypothetical protein
MKRCPTCGLTLDDSQTFCTNDGTPLVEDKSSYDPQATMIVPPSSVPLPPPPFGGAPGGGQSPQTGWQSPARPTAPPGYGSPQPQPNFGAQSSYDQPASGAQPGKFIPGLIGGAVTGILALFASFLEANAFMVVSFFCIVWAFIGGALASMLYIKKSPNPVRPGEGAILGTIAGGIGALIYVALDTVVAYNIHGEYIEWYSKQQGNDLTAGAFFAVTGLVGALTIIIFSVIGGLVGVPMFEKRKGFNPNVPPPPPPGYGGPMGGYR